MCRRPKPSLQAMDFPERHSFHIVQSIRAHRVPGTQDAATQLNQHFSVIQLSAQTKQDILT
jgi:hypothetical protein